ncbi:MAG: PASTA domain-containing protein, partial [Endomicrobia bacterium]|nr:PASTA domain-containing protein [Endomicrobiia bacterium]
MSNKKKKIKNLIINGIYIIGIYSIIIVLILVVMYKLVGLMVHSKKEVIVPNIINKPVSDALDIVSKIGLGLKKVGEVYNPEYPAGTVVSQQPSAGMTVREGRFVNVILSLGGEKVFVPDVIGEDYRKAEIVLRQYNLLIGTITERYSLRYSKNKIIQQNPVAGAVVDKNSYVDIVVSLGMPPEGQSIVLMPDFVNKNVNEVYLWAQKYNIEVQVEQKLIPGVEEGVVVEQSPLPDSVIEPA